MYMYIYIYTHAHIHTHTHTHTYTHKHTQSFTQLRQLGDKGIQANQFNRTSGIKNREFGSQGRNQSYIWYKDMCSQLAYSTNTRFYSIASHQEC